MRGYMLGLAAVSFSAVIGGACQERGAETESAASERPDISGVWLGVAVPHLEPTAPMTERGQALFDATRPMYGPRAVPVANSDDPLITCDPLGFPRSILHELRGMEFVQSPNRVVQLLQYQRTFREIWTDGRSLPADVGGTTPQSVDPKWYGYSIGRWTDADTFVVETTGATETSWGERVRASARPWRAHRGTVPSRRPGTLELVVTIDDLEMYQKPFVAMKMAFKRGKELEEQLCVPSEALRYFETVAKPAAENSRLGP